MLFQKKKKLPEQLLFLIFLSDRNNRVSTFMSWLEILFFVYLGFTKSTSGSKEKHV